LGPIGNCGTGEIDFPWNSDLQLREASHGKTSFFEEGSENRMENRHNSQDANIEDTFRPPESQRSDSWVQRHGLWLVFLVAAFAYFMTQYDPWTIIKVVLGISMLIFVHELGHFLVAKACNVHVQTFSIGFGPAIPGCSYRWGETTYKIGFIPLGGYVKMLGEGADEKDGEDDPRSFKNKTVGQRMAIISAGVTMNIIFGFACFVYVYMAHGETRMPAVIDVVEAGSPAWENGIRTGQVVLQIGNKRNPYFDDFKFQVMNSVKGEKLDLNLQSPEEPEAAHVRIEPRRTDQDQMPIIGVIPSHELKLFSEAAKKYRSMPVLKESAAAEANPPFEFDDEIIGTTDPAEPDNLDKILPLPPDPRTPKEAKHLDYFEFQKRLRLLAHKKIIIQVRRAKSSKLENIAVPEAFHYVLPGLVMEMGEVTALRQLDPTRLPFDLAQWAGKKTASRQVTLVVRRENSTQTLKLDWDDRWQFNRELSLGPRWCMSIPGLGIAYQVRTTVRHVTPDSPAYELGVRDGDVIKACRFRRPGKKPTDEPILDRSWTELKPTEWCHVFEGLQMSDIKEVSLRLSRDDVELTMPAQQDKTWPMEDRGLAFQPETVLVKAENVGQALSIGWGRTWDFICGIYGNLRSLATGRVSFIDNISGPISVAEAAYIVADEDNYQYILLLAIISINLAIVNFLPIPVLDGGHMVFLIYEKLCRRPASRQVRVATTYVGLALILCLMVFVIYLDLKKKFT
jgi:regulator of sigma E protease